MQVKEGGTQELTGEPLVSRAAREGMQRGHAVTPVLCSPLSQAGWGWMPWVAVRWGVLLAALTAASLQLLDACSPSLPPTVWAPLAVTPFSTSPQAQDTWQWPQAAQRVRDQAPCLLTRMSVQAASP